MMKILLRNNGCPVDPNQTWTAWIDFGEPNLSTWGYTHGPTCFVAVRQMIEKLRTLWFLLESQVYDTHLFDQTMIKKEDGEDWMTYQQFIQT